MWRLVGFVSRMGTTARLAAYACLLTAAVGGSVWGAHALFSAAIVEVAQPTAKPRVQAKATARPQLAQSRPSYVTLNQDWHDQIRTREFWSGRPSNRNPAVYNPNDRPSYLMSPSDLLFPWGLPEIAPRTEQGGTYRTMCVRMCDGFYWPVSYATTRENFARDEAKCEKSCGSPARLFVYRNPGGEPEDMKSIDGELYSKLPTAFLFRTKYLDQCRCGPQPWDKEALQRHQVYALEAAKRKGDKTATQQLADLKARQIAEQRRRLLSRQLALAGIRAGSKAVRQPAPAQRAATEPPKEAPRRFDRIVGRGHAKAAAVTPRPVDDTPTGQQPGRTRAIDPRQAVTTTPPAAEPVASQRPLKLLRLGNAQTPADATPKGAEEPAAAPPIFR